MSRIPGLRLGSRTATAIQARRRDRRPGFPIESRVTFYPRYAADSLKKHWLLVWHYGRLRRQLKRDPEARNYMDEVLTPVTEDAAEEVRATGAHERRPGPALVSIGS